MTSPAVIVFPRPTSSAMSIWHGHESISRLNARNWCGHGLTALVTSPTRRPFGRLAASRMKAQTCRRRSSGESSSSPSITTGTGGSSSSWASSSRMTGAIGSGRTSDRSFSRTASGTSITRTDLARPSQKSANASTSSLTCFHSRPPSHDRWTWKLSRLLSQPFLDSFTLPLNEIWLPSASVMMPTFS